ncbi:MAG: iron-sulfur cluster assembly accessory protein, partial [Anaerolineae bacterium]
MTLATSSATQTETQQVFLTEAAAQAVQDLLAKRNLDGYALRLFISGGGCSGYQYGMALDNNIRESDLKFTYHGVDLVVDEISIQYVNGATIDYVEDNLMG